MITGAFIVYSGEIYTFEFDFVPNNSNINNMWIKLVPFDPLSDVLLEVVKPAFSL